MGGWNTSADFISDIVKNVTVSYTVATSDVIDSSYIHIYSVCTRVLL